MDSTPVTSSVGGTVGTALSATGIALSITQVQAIISIVATVLGLILTITTTIIIPLIRNIKQARKDGKVEPEEIDKIGQDLANGIEELDKYKKGEIKNGKIGRTEIDGCGDVQGRNGKDTD